MEADIQAFEVMASALQERGVMTAEQVAADRAAQFPDAQAPQQPQPTLEPGAPPSKESETLDALAFSGPTNPAAYRFGTLPPGVQHDPQQESAIRSLFAAEQVPVEMAQHVDKLYTAAIQNPPTEQQKEMQRQDAVAFLQRQWGGDYDKNLAVVQKEIARMTKAEPRIREMLEWSGLGNNPWIVTSVFNIAKARGRA